jgi:hypothetical protein
MGDKITIYTNRREAYTHTLRYQIGNSSGTIATGVGDSYEWQIPLSLASLVPSEPNPTITIACDTYNGQVAMGSVTVALAAIVPNNLATRPRVTVTLSPTRDVMNGLYLSGANGVFVSVEATSDYSVIDTYNTKVLNWQSSSPTYSSPNLPDVQSAKVVCTVTDKRGFSTTKEETIEVISYSWPRIVPSANKEKVLCVRCDANGNEDPTGTKLLVDLGKSYSKVIANGVQNNFCSLSYQWKTSETGFSEPVEILPRTSGSDYVRTVLDLNVSLDNEYTIRFIAKDDRGAEGTHEEKVSTAFATFHSPVGGRGITFGGYHNPEKVNVLDCRFDAEFAGNVTGSVLGLGKLPVLQSSYEVESLYTPGVYALANDDEIVMPEHKPGTIRVSLADGVDENKVTQEYIPNDGVTVWKRTMTKSPASRTNWIPVGGINYIVKEFDAQEFKCRHYADGSAECWGAVTFQSGQWSGENNLYYVAHDIFLPAFAFSDRPSVFTSVISAGGAVVFPTVHQAIDNQRISIDFGRLYGGTNDVSITLAVYANGRWKQ